MKTPIAAILIAGSAATAGTVQLAAYTNNSGISSQIDTTVSISADAGSVTFELNNNTPTGRIDIFYIEMGAALAGVNAGSAVIDNSDPGVNFAVGGTPNSPGGGISGWAGNFFRMAATSAGEAVQFGESVAVTFTHDGSFSLAALMASIGDGSLRLTQHYIGFGPNEDSEFLVSVPLPPAAWAGIGTLAAAAGVRGWRRRASR